MPNVRAADDTILTSGRRGDKHVNTLQPDAVIKVRFKRMDEGGRRGGLTCGVYHCICYLDGVAHDCRVYLEERTLELGQEYRVPVRFLAPEIVIPKLSVGKIVSLWEGKEVATGEVVAIKPETWSGAAAP
jgi:hypothetical protein